mmetsp:Transcript_81902/g.144601  ORF Transcript_81902/g.144601 Transcript_81902/m.144601 type:complete len:241 (+) Transcript_81902:3904-4626(+)
MDRRAPSSSSEPHTFSAIASMASSCASGKRNVSFQTRSSMGRGVVSLMKSPHQISQYTNARGSMAWGRCVACSTFSSIRFCSIPEMGGSQGWSCVGCVASRSMRTVSSSPSSALRRRGTQKFCSLSCVKSGMTEAAEAVPRAKSRPFGVQSSHRLKCSMSSSFGTLYRRTEFHVRAELAGAVHLVSPLMVTFTYRLVRSVPGGRLNGWPPMTWRSNSEALMSGIVGHTWVQSRRCGHGHG